MMAMGLRAEPQARAIAAVLAAVLAGAAVGQQPDEINPAAERAWTTMIADWSSTDPTPAEAERIRLLEAFVEQFPKGHYAARGWSRLGGLRLRTLDGAGAVAAFSSALNQTGDADRDVVGRCLYGLAQAQELEGRSTEAVATLERLQRELPRTRYSRFARVGLERLLRRSPPPTPDQRLPALELGPDVRTAKAPPTQDRPWLLVFFDSGHPEAVDRLSRVWHEATAPGPMIAIDVSGQRAWSAKVAEEHQWPCHTVCTDDGFLHPDILRLGVTATPTWFLVGADRRLLARDVPVERLRRLLR